MLIRGTIPLFRVQEAKTMPITVRRSATTVDSGPVAGQRFDRVSDTSESQHR